MRSSKFLTAAAAAVVGCFFATNAVAQGATNADQKCGTVSIAQMNWAAATVTTNVAKFLLEQGYGCKVALVKSDTIPAITSVAQNGSPDVVTNLWLNSAGDAYKKLEKAGTMKRLTNVLKPGGIEGWWIPSYLAKEHPELTTIEGIMKHPDWVGGRFNNCPDGWGCRVVNDNLIRALKLEDSGLKVFNHGSGKTLASSMGAAVTDHKPWFGYYWGPTVPMGKYNLTRVKIGDYDKAAFDNLQNQKTSDPQVSDFPAGPILTSVTTKFAKSHPAVTEFFTKMSFETDSMSKLLAWQDANHASAEQTAAHFLSTEQDVWSTWLSAPATKKLSKLLKQKS